MPEVTFTQHSRLKRSYEDSSQLSATDFLPVEPDKKLLIVDSEPAPNNNVKLYGPTGFSV